ncbi:MAG: hypothetical protein ACM31C_24255 [Acidobacteriota bacterium]
MRLACALVLLAACARSTPSERELVAGAQDETRRFFALAEGGDCDHLEAMMQLPAQCHNMVREFLDTHAHLLAIDEAELDGRDKHVVLVTVKAQTTKELRRWIVRAKWTAGGWRLAL